MGFLWHILWPLAETVVADIAAKLSYAGVFLRGAVLLARRAIAPPTQQQRPRVVLITGASSGIGAAVAEHYARTVPGVTLGLIGRNKERTAVVAARCTGLGAGAVVVGAPVDVSDRAAMREWIDAFDADHPIDLLVASAGANWDTVVAASDGHPTEEEAAAEPGTAAEAEVQARIVATNVTGILNTATPVVHRMAMRRRGSVALVGSLMGEVAWRGVYSATKAFVATYARSLRVQMARHGVQVSAVLPGLVTTPMTERFQAGGAPSALFCTPEYAAQAIADGVAMGAPEIAFPPASALGIRFLKVLPSSVYHIFADSHHQQNA